MSIGAQTVRIKLEENGEEKFLKNITLQPVSYETDAVGDQIAAQDVPIIIRALKNAEPEKVFVVVV